MVDNGFVLTGNDAILKYLANSYDVAEQWYPRDPERRARVDEYTTWHQTNTSLDIGHDVLRDHLKLLTWRSCVQSALKKSFDDAHAVLYCLGDKARL
ncbi:GSTT1 transferase, partial [Amia calva]|nr:GSTT1 transferase [Amia calva]